MDEVALEAVLPQHPSGVAREVQAVGCRKEWIDVKRRGRQEDQKFGEALEKKEGEGVQGGQGLPSRRESDLEEEWGMEMDFEGEVESRKKLDEQRRRLQMLKSSHVCRKSFRKTLRVTCNSCERWSKGGTTSCQNTRKCSKDRRR